MKISSALLLVFALAGSAWASPPSTWLDFSLSSFAVSATCKAAREKAGTSLAKVSAVAPAQAGFQNTLVALSDALSELGDATNGPIFLGEVSTDPSVRDAGHACDADTSRFFVDVYSREDLYRPLKAYAASKPKLTGEDARLLEKTVLAFKRSGLDLPKDKRDQVAGLRKRIVDLETGYRKQLGEDKSTGAFTSAELAGMPDDFIQRLPKQGDLYLVSTDYPDYFPFMENAKDADARRRLEILFDNRGGEANSRRLAEALRLRREAARLLGYSSHADFVLEDRMAKTPAAALRFLKDLRAKLERKGRPELAALAALKKGELGAKSDGIIHIWDWRYYHHRLLRERYDVDDQKIKEYFPMDVVTEGLLGVYQQLLGVKFTPVEPAEAWHPDVKLFKVSDAASGELIGHFYMDLFPREGKYKHAAAFSLVCARRMPDGSYQRPVSAIVANFDKPTPDHPSLLRHEEVETFFHEFGHIMHQTLTKAQYQRFSGSNVALDFVEAPSQMLENWVWKAEVLEKLSGQYQDHSKKLPRELLDKMVAAKNVDSGITYLRQDFFATLDLTYHGRPVDDVTQTYARLMREISLIPMTPGTRPEAGFGHLMGGYDAGYYGYLWSKVFAQDMFSRFEMLGVLDPKTGGDYRREILEPGSGREEAVSLRRFLGREPSDEPFLRSIGLETAARR